jgi:hypothetical protein
VQLGSTTLSLENLDTYRSAINAWQHSLSADADLLFYGCNLAATADGRELMNQIAAESGSDVAASDDNTGHAALGGDWDLEYSVGSIETNVAFSQQLQDNWSNLLNVSIDATSTGTTSGATTTISHTTTATSDRLMLVGVTIRPNSGETVSSVTYNSTALSFVGAQNGPAGARVEIWSLVAPDAGTHDVDVTLSAGTHGGVTVGIMTFTGVDQTTALGTFASGSGDATSGSVAVSSAAGEVVFGVVSVKDADQNLVPGTGRTEHWDLFTGSEANGGAVPRPVRRPLTCPGRGPPVQTGPSAVFRLKRLRQTQRPRSLCQARPWDIPKAMARRSSTPVPRRLTPIRLTSTVAHSRSISPPTAPPMIASRSTIKALAPARSA